MVAFYQNDAKISELKFTTDRALENFQEVEVLKSAGVDIYKMVESSFFPKRKTSTRFFCSLEDLVLVHCSENIVEDYIKKENVGKYLFVKTESGVNAYLPNLNEKDTSEYKSYFLDSKANEMRAISLKHLHSKDQLALIPDDFISQPFINICGDVGKHFYVVNKDFLVDISNCNQITLKLMVALLDQYSINDLLLSKYILKRDWEIFINLLKDWHEPRFIRGMRDMAFFEVNGYLFKADTVKDSWYSFILRNVFDWEVQSWMLEDADGFYG